MPAAAARAAGPARQRPPAVRGGIRPAAAGPDRAAARARWPDRAARRSAECRAPRPRRSPAEPIAPRPGRPGSSATNSWYAAATASISWNVSGRPAGAISRRASRQPRDRRASRARTSRDEAAPQRRTGQLPPRREQLLHDERVAGRPLGDEEQHRRRRTLALDRADQLRDLRTRQRPEHDALRRPRPFGESDKVAGERMVAGQAIRLVGARQGRAAGHG